MDKCPACGYQENVATVFQTNKMSEYVYPNGKTFGVLNNDAKHVTIPASKGVPEVKLIRKDVFESMTPEKPATPAPSKPAVPAK